MLAVLWPRASGLTTSRGFFPWIRLMETFLLLDVSSKSFSDRTRSVREVGQTTEVQAER